MKKVASILILYIFCCFQTATGQVDTTQQQVIPTQNDTIPIDSVPAKRTVTTPNPENFTVAKDALDDNVEYGARDSMNYDNFNNRVHLYGDAFVKYQGLELKAGYIEISLDSNIAVAEEVIDSFGQQSGQPSFTDGSQNFSANKMRYNFKSNKGIVYDVATTQSNLFLKGKKTKFVTQEGTKGDSTYTDKVLYNRNAIFSTCDAPHPHYGIRSRKQKVIADKVVVVGLSNLEIGGVPTPFFLPFGFFPLKQFKSTGLIFPRGYEYSPQLGFGLDGIGWYFPISEKLDLRLTSQLYWHGTWGITADSRYKKRYKYSGSLNLNYTSIRSLDATSRENSYSIRWSHNQDTKAHPTRRFTGSINIRGNGIQRFNNNRNDAQSVLQNTLSSNVSYNQTFPGKPYRLSMAMSHSQILTPEGLRTGNRAPNVNISFPTVNFQMNRIYPFKKDRGGNKEKWYEKVSFKYDGQFQNKLTATDSTLFTQQTFDDMRFGFRHNAATDMNFNILKYVSVSPNASFNEVWYFHTLRRVHIDTLENTRTESLPAIYQELQDSIDFGFQPWHQFSAGISMSTNLYGTLQFKKGRLRGIRHTIRPSISFNFTPDYTKENGFFGGYFRNYDGDPGVGVDTLTYSIFQGGLYGSPNFNSSGRRMALSYSINNIFEAKFRPKRDSVDKKIKLFDNIRMGGSYNFAADSLKFSDISINGTTRLFKGITNLNITARYTPYTANFNNRKINTFYWRTNRKPLRFLNANFRVATRLSIRDIKNLLNKGGSTTANRTNRNSNDASQDGPTNNGENSFLKFLEGFNLNYTFALNATKAIDQPTSWEVRTHNINVRIREIKVSDKWSLTVGNIGYDFRNKRSTYPDIGIIRDLHCWEARFNWQPQRGTYYFTIKVRNAPLDMLKLPYQKNFVDTFGGF